MPQLKQLSCCVQWTNTNAPFQEHGTVYGDGLVETFIIVPNKPQGFCIRLTSRGYIYEGLAMIVFIDGQYQCNRTRVNLLPPKKERAANRTEVDFLLRQKEKPHGDGVYMGREWRFDNHNIGEIFTGNRKPTLTRCPVAEAPDGFQESHFDDLGTIEVLVLRCRAADPEEAKYEGSSSGEDDDVFGEHPVRDEFEEVKASETKTESKTTAEKAPPATGAPAEEDEVGGLFGLFGGDGANDRYGPPGQNGHDAAVSRQWVWHQQEPPPVLCTNQREPHHSSTQAPSRPPPHYNEDQQGLSGPPKHVRFDYGAENEPRGRRPSVQTPGRPSEWADEQRDRSPSRERMRSNDRRPFDPSRRPSGPPYDSQQMYHKPNSSQWNRRERPDDSRYYDEPERRWGYGDGSSTGKQEWNRSDRSNANVASPQHSPQQQQHRYQLPPRRHPYAPEPQYLPREPLPHINQPTYLPQYSQPYPVEPFVPYVPPTRPPLQIHPGYHVPLHPAPTQPYMPAFHPSYWSPNYHPVLPQPYAQPHYPQYHASHGQGRYHDVEEQISPKNTTYDAPGMNNDLQGPSDHWASDNAQTGEGNGPGSGPQNGESNDNTENSWDNDNGGQNGANDTKQDDDWANDGKNANDQNNEDDQNGENNNDWGNDNSGNGSNDVNSGWDNNNNNANANNNTWDDAANNTGSGATWGNENTNNSAPHQEPDVHKVTPAMSAANAPRDLYGPHGPYYSFRALRLDEPRPVAEEEPRYDVPEPLAAARGSTKQVQPGPGYRYYKKRIIPEYIDSFDNPYARFVFKYRTKGELVLVSLVTLLLTTIIDQLPDEIGIEVDVEPTGDQEIQDLQILDKQSLIEMLMRAKSALGGKVPSPPLVPSIPLAGSDMSLPVAVDAPSYSYLKYSLPPLRPSNVKSDRPSPAGSVSSGRQGSAGKENAQQGQQNSGNWNASVNNNNDWGTQAPNGQGAAQTRQDSRTTGAGAAAEGGSWDLDNDVPPEPPVPDQGLGGVVSANSQANDWGATGPSGGSGGW